MQKQEHTEAEAFQGHIHRQAIVDSANVGDGTRVWAFSHVMDGASIGRSCNIGEGCFIESGACLGSHVTLKNGVSVWTGIDIGDYAFIGPNVVFTNDLRPRAWIKPPQFVETSIGRGVSIGANSTIICGVTLDRFGMIGAGSVVTQDTKPFELLVGNPARHQGWVCICGQKLKNSEARCSCGVDVIWNDDGEPSIDEEQPVVQTAGLLPNDRPANKI